MLKFAREQAGRDVPEPPAFRAAVDKIARSGGTPLGLVEGGRILGVIHLKDVVKPDVKERFAALRRMGIKTVMITGDNPVTAAAIASEAGVDDFIAQATPEDKLRYIRNEQAQGRLIAMCGDGTNDAPALAQADVGVAMQTGTQAAREAGNMVDLDSDPTKLIEVVEIGKQLLMTRGALTTFSIANDVAKYFAIIPAIFLAFYPQLAVLNIMQLATPQSAILSAIIFNALIIIALIPLALKGVAYRPIGAGPLLQRNLLIYGAGRHRAAVHRHQGHRPGRHRLASGLRRIIMLKEIRPAIVILVLLTAITGPCLPARHDRHCGSHLPAPGAGQSDREGRQGRSAQRLIGQVFADDKYFHGRPSATNAPDPKDATKTIDAPYNAVELHGLESRPDQQGAGRPAQGRRGHAQEREPVGGGPGRFGDDLGQRPRPRYFAGGRPFPGAAGRQGAWLAGRARPCAGRQPNRGPHTRPAGRAAGQCAQAQPRTRRS